MAKKDKPPPSEEQLAAEAVKHASFAEAIEDYDRFAQARASQIWSYQELPFSLNLEEQLFVRSYVIDRNEVAAMRRLGHYTDDQAKLKARAKRYMNKSEVKEAIEWLAKRMMEALDVTAEKVQRRIAAAAFFDPREVLEFDSHGVAIAHSRFWTREQAQAIKGIKMGQNGVEIQFYDGLKASEMLAKQVGLQEDESDYARQSRIAADETMDRIAEIMGRLMPGGKKVIDAHFTERRQLRDARSDGEGT